MFPTTRHSVLHSIASPEPEQRRRGLEALAEAYWRPVYKYLRLRWGAPAEEAEDLAFLDGEVDAADGLDRFAAGLEGLLQPLGLDEHGFLTGG